MIQKLVNTELKRKFLGWLLLLLSLVATLLLGYVAYLELIAERFLAAGILGVPCILYAFLFINVEKEMERRGWLPFPPHREQRIHKDPDKENTEKNTNMIMNQDEITINGQKYKRVDNEKWIEEKYVRVPDNIHFDTQGDLMFNDDKQTLYADKGHYGVAVFLPPMLSDETRYLVPCERSDLEPGDVAFILGEWENVEELASELVRYLCVLDEEKCAYIGKEKDVFVSSFRWPNCYRVMTKKEIQDMEARR